MSFALFALLAALRLLALPPSPFFFFFWLRFLFCPRRLFLGSVSAVVVVVLRPELLELLLVAPAAASSLSLDPAAIQRGSVMRSH